MGMKITDAQAQLQWLQTLINQADTDRKPNEISYNNEFTSLLNQINNTTDTTTLANVTPNVNRFSEKMKTRGYDELSLDSVIGTKNYVFNQAKIAYDEGEKIAKSWELDPYTDPDGEGKKISKWAEVDASSYEDVTKRINELGSYISNITTAITHPSFGGYLHKTKDGDERFNKEVILKSFQKEIGVWMNKDAILDKRKDMFTIDKNEDGVPDIESMAFYEELREKMLTGDVEGFSQWFDSYITNIGKKYQRNEKMYINLKEVYDQIDPEKYKVTGDLELKGGDDESQLRIKNLLEGSGITAYKSVTKNQLATIKSWLHQSFLNLQKFNAQYEILTKTPFDSNPIHIHDSMLHLDEEDVINMGGAGNINANQVRDSKIILNKMIKGAFK